MIHHASGPHALFHTTKPVQEVERYAIPKVMHVLVANKSDRTDVVVSETEGKVSSCFLSATYA